MSILSYLSEQKKQKGTLGFEVEFLYSTKEPGEANEILFLDRLWDVFNGLENEGMFRLFLTPTGQVVPDDRFPSGRQLSIKRRRIQDADLLTALSLVSVRKGTTCYICGVPGMTDRFVNEAVKAEGMEKSNVLFEKWW